MTTLLKPLSVRDKLLKLNLPVFSLQDFARIFPAPSYRLKYFLEEQVRQGLLFRLKKSLYALKTDYPREERIANSLYNPSYISFEYALSYHNIIPEMPYQITSATTKPSRLFLVNQIAFAFYTIKRQAYTGYTLITKGTDSFLMADPEKALADYLYFVSLGKKEYNDRIDLNKIDKKKFYKFVNLFSRKSLFKLAEKIYDH